MTTPTSSSSEPSNASVDLADVQTAVDRESTLPSIDEVTRRTAAVRDGFAESLSPSTKYNHTDGPDDNPDRLSEQGKIDAEEREAV